MAYQIYYHPEIPSDVAHLPKNIQERIRRAIEERLLQDPAHYGVPLRKSLQGYRKLRVGDYRIIFKIDGNNIIVLKIGPRKDVYQKADWRVLSKVL